MRASYNQAEYLEDRRYMMQQWADLIDDITKEKSKVTPIKRVVA